MCDSVETTCSECTKCSRCKDRNAVMVGKDYCVCESPLFILKDGSDYECEYYAGKFKVKKTINN